MNAGAITDDSTIGNDEVIWRRIHQYQVVDDVNLKRKRPSSAGFNQDGKENPVSVYIASEAISSQMVMQGGKEQFLASLSASFIRQLGLGIIRDSSSGSPGHALLVGRKTGSMLNKMARAASWVPPYAP
jgi:hypothetical protein